MLSFKDVIDRKTLPLREQFILGDVLNIGQLVEDDTGKYQILDRGTNYLICANNSGRIVKKFLSQVKSISEVAQLDTISCFKGFCSEINDPIVESCFISLVDKYNNGLIVDSIAILKALRAYNEGDTESLKVSLTRLNELDNHIYIEEVMSDNIKNTDKLKVASVIATTLGVDSDGNNAEMMVNNALRNARKNPMLTGGEGIKIIMRMLELAKSVGIKYDDKLIKAVDESEFSGSSYNKVTVTRQNGKKMNGKLQALHGSVQEIKYRNGKIGYHHSYHVSKLEEDDSPMKRTFFELMAAIANSAGKGVSVADETIKSSTLGVEHGHGMKPSSDTHRKQLIKKLLDH